MLMIFQGGAKRTRPKPVSKHDVRAKTYSKCIGGYMVNGKCVSSEKINNLNNQKGPCPAGYGKAADGSCIQIQDKQWQSNQ